ncbi:MULTISPECIES: DNA replication terminus site-binding protein [unclassified Halomonas]|uniref:DNA replication terminus site-binding protein n=1 Tax=unclassified Halomonas TaxID=2609666 RepID=UPI0028888E90|nr:MULTISPECIES: DNA replication terminus site-binding protein [unclassified Halomonas]MDT0500479.1 DNA replication terminus site-binding protein [Halomonas sp. PAR7]MDT0511625.1 DNA replication terminus site-binding protein [Halomonas sp. LES1]MDT0590087.1 DNA replication terminus site-binding protein [Halomonas sp. PAR8]
MTSSSSQRPEYRLLAELEAAFDALVETTAAVAEAHARAPGACWIFGEPEPVDGERAAAWLREALQDVWYQDGQDGRATRAYIGLVAAGDEVMEAVAAANATKAAFAALTAKIRDQAPSLIPEAKAVLPFRHPALHDHLRGEGLARVHLKQCWRAIPASEAPLTRVRLAWYSSGRSIKKLTVREAEQKLLTFDSEAPHIRIQLRKLAGIPSGEPLAQVQRQAPLMRANLFYREPLEDGRTRRAMNVALPLFVPSPDGRLPDHNLPPLQPPETRTRARRRDEKLEDEPFLPSLRVYRYR